MVKTFSGFLKISRLILILIIFILFKRTLRLNTFKQHEQRALFRREKQRMRITALWISSFFVLRLQQAVSKSADVMLRQPPLQ